MQGAAELLQNLDEETAGLFSLVQKQGPLTKSEIAHAAGIKLTTLNRMMQPLEREALIVQSCIGESTGGRKPVLYDVNPGRFSIIGVDISRTYTQIVATDLKLQVLGRYDFPMDAACSPEQTVRRITDWTEHFFQQPGRERDGLMGIGIGTVGPLDRERGILLNPVNFEAPGWQNASLKEMLGERFHYPVFVDNGANTAVLGEVLFGKGRGVKNSVYIHCGIGIRTGAISAGTIVRTLNDAEDAFGHMVVNVDGEPCRCGKNGCVEGYASAVAITEKYLLKRGKSGSGGMKRETKAIPYVELFNAVSKDPLAREAVAEAAEVLGTALANLINLLDPALVVLSGPLMKQSSLFYEVCVETALKKCGLKKEGKIAFSCGGDFEESAIAVGAAALVVESLLRSKMLDGV